MRLLKNTSFLILAGILLYACKQQVVQPDTLADFGVTADSSKASGDTAYYTLGSKATFNFTGNPFTITFFSGEPGHQYIYRSRTTAQGTSKFVFTSALNAGTQTGSLRVMLSTDFKGVALSTSKNVIGNPVTATDTATTIANIAAATWTDITPTNLATSATAVTSTIDLTSYASAGKPVFIAFKYTAQQGSIQNKWTITNVSVSNALPDGTQYTIANLNASATPIVNYGTNTYSPGWVSYTPANSYNWVVTAGTSLVITGASTASAATANAEAWAFMGSIDLSKVSPDAGVAVKGISALPAAYQYLYTAKGSYAATFLATNNSQYTTDSVVKVIPVVIR